jgi:hypothetical protein
MMAVNNITITITKQFFNQQHKEFIKMTTITGYLIQLEFGTTEAVANLEVIIDSCVDTVNSDAGTVIGYMLGTTPSKVLTVTGLEAAALKPLIAMKLASKQVAGGNSLSYSVGGLSKSTSTNVGSSNSNSQLYERAITNLRNATRQPPIVVANEQIDYS